MKQLKETFHKLTQERIWVSEERLKKLSSDQYQRQAINFLLETETTCDIQLMGLRNPNWKSDSKAVNCYNVTLKNKNHTYSFDFYDSIKNTEENKSAKFNFYSVLACMGHYTSESFDEFCSNFGYEFKNESDYIRTKTVHLACLDQDKNLKKLFTSEQLEKLQEIN